jgi:hypothetical protein
MQKLGYLASVLLLASVIIGPIGLSHAQTVDTHKDSKVKHDEMRANMDQTRAEKLDSLKARAADAKAAFNAKKAAAQKAIDEMIAARNQAIKKSDLPTAADLLAQIKEEAKNAIDARKPAGGPSKVQKALEKDREAFSMRVQEHQKMIPKSPDKDIKSVKDDSRLRPKTLKALDAVDQLSKEEAQKAEEKKAEADRAKAYAEMHHKNRK